MQKITAKLNYLNMAPRKVRLIADTLRKLPAQEAEAQLLMRPHRVAGPLLKLLRSAVANARNNFKLEANKLVIGEIFVGKGPMLKRFLPRAMGRATPIHKIMSHITLVLQETGKVHNPRFAILPPAKKAKKSPKHDYKDHKPKAEKPTSEKSKEKSGFFRKMFSRKTGS